MNIAVPWFWWTDVVLWFESSLSQLLLYSLHTALKVLIWIGCALFKVLFLILGSLSKLFIKIFSFSFSFSKVISSFSFILFMKALVIIFIKACLLAKYLFILYDGKFLHDTGSQTLTACSRHVPYLTQTKKFFFLIKPIWV